MHRRQVLTALPAALAAPWAIAQPQAPLKILVGNAPGGISDVVARIIAEQLSPLEHRPVVVENKPGAAGNIAAEMVARAPADGSTMLMIYNSHPSIPALYPKLPFDPIRDFRSVGLVAGNIFLLSANPAVPGNNLAEVLANARRSGRPLSFASPGNGSPQHLMAERLRIQTHTPITVVHYKGAAPGMADVAGGHVDFMISSTLLAQPQIQAGRLKALAVSSEQRLPQFPDTPTVREQGIEGFPTVGWLGLLLPAQTPEAIARRYNAEVNGILARAEIRSRIDAMGAVTLAGPPEALDKTIHDEAAMWGKLIHDLGIRGE